MKRNPLIFAGAVVIALVLPLAVTSLAGADDEVVWLSSPDDALKAAKKESKPILVLLTRSDDESSRRMHEETFADAKVAPLLAKYVLIQVDVAKQPEEIRRIRELTGEPNEVVPDMRILDEDGMPFDRIIGFADAKRTVAFLTKGIDGAGKGSGF